jgi:hypothetical protein
VFNSAFLTIQPTNIPHQPILLFYVFTFFDSKVRFHTGLWPLHYPCPVGYFILIFLFSTVANIVFYFASLDTPSPPCLSISQQFTMRASIVILGFLATLTVALPEARPEAAITCQSVSLIRVRNVIYHQVY